MFIYFSQAVFCHKTNAEERREQSVLCNAIWNPWPHSSSCTIRKSKEEEQKVPTKAPAKNIFSSCCYGLSKFPIVTDTALECCAEQQEEHIWSCITSGSVLCFLFLVTIKLRVQHTWTNFPLPITSNKKKPTLPHFPHAENKRRSPAPRTVFTERNCGVKGLGVLPNTISTTISKYMFHRQVKTEFYSVM